jgi:ACS family tartrate transporter-like MFS transporter
MAELASAAKAMPPIGAQMPDQLFVKCARRLIPVIALLMMMNYVDRVNVGFAALTMNRDLGFSPSVFGLGAGMFYVGYCLFQVPVSILAARLGAGRVIFCIAASWGLLSSACAFIRNPASFYILRFLLGAAEAGIFPAIMVYLSCWFPQAYRGRHTATIQGAAQFAFVLGGPLSGVMLGMDGVAGFHGWQWLFLVEGLPTLLCAVAILRILPDRPSQAPWLTGEERAVIAARLAADDSTQAQELWKGLCDPRIYALGLALFCVSVGDFGLQLWWPQMVQGMGFSNRSVGFVVALAYLVSIPAAIVLSRSSDVRGERSWHVAFAAMFAASGLILASLAPDYRLRLVGLIAATVGLFASRPPMNNLPLSFLGGSAGAAGMALYNSIGTFGGFAGAAIIGILKQHSGSYASAMAALALGPVISAVIVLKVGRGLVFKPAAKS